MVELVETGRFCCPEEHPNEGYEPLLCLWPLVREDPAFPKAVFELDERNCSTLEFPKCDFTAEESIQSWVWCAQLEGSQGISNGIFWEGGN